jgi:hypothetical protein
MKTHYMFGGATSLVLALSLIGQAHGQQTPEEGAAKGNEGKACTVTSGGNAGKTGTIMIEGGAEYCEGSWGATDCTASATNPSKCSIAKVGGGKLPGLAVADRQLLQSYASAKLSGSAALTEWETKYGAKVVSERAGVLTLSVSGRTFVVDGSVKALTATRIR